MWAMDAARCWAMRLPICSAYAGHHVAREYYINDAGAQVDVLARSAYLRYREALGEEITIPEGLYPGDYLKPIGQALAAEFGKELLGKPESEWIDVVRSAAIGGMMEMIRADLAALGIKHDVFFSERTLTTSGEGDLVAQAIAELRAKGLVYEGRLQPPKGQAIEDWEDREQVLFRSTAIRRRCRSAADEIGRQLHLFCCRYRLS